MRPPTPPLTAAHLSSYPLVFPAAVLTVVVGRYKPARFPRILVSGRKAGYGARRYLSELVVFLLYIIQSFLSFSQDKPRWEFHPGLWLSGGYAASLMYFVWLPSCQAVPREEGQFFCKTYGLVNISLRPISQLSCVLRRRDLLRRS